jgi:hypothetical protein
VSTLFDHAWCALRTFALGAAIVVLSGSARAAESDIVLLGRPDPLPKQIDAELSASGFRVVWVETAQALPTSIDAEAAAAEADALAVVYAMPALRDVEVWFLDVAGITRAHEVLHTEPSLIDSDRVVAVRLVELLRARLFEQELSDLAPNAALDGEQPTEPVSAIAGELATPGVGAKSSSSAQDMSSTNRSRAPSSFVFDAGFGAGSSFRATGLSPYFTLGASWQALPRFTFGLSARGPLARELARIPPGTTRTASWELFAGSRFFPIVGDSPVWPSLAAGLGVFWFQVEIDRGVCVLATDQIFTTGPQVDVGVHWRLSRRFSLRSTLAAIYPLSEPGVIISSKSIALRRPLVMGALAVEFRTDSTASGD